jgi:hypothetical protein
MESQRQAILSRQHLPKSSHCSTTVSGWIRMTHAWHNSIVLPWEVPFKFPHITAVKRSTDCTALRGLCLNIWQTLDLNPGNGCETVSWAMANNGSDWRLVATELVYLKLAPLRAVPEDELDATVRCDWSRLSNVISRQKSVRWSRPGAVEPRPNNIGGTAGWTGSYWMGWNTSIRVSHIVVVKRLAW